MTKFFRFTIYNTFKDKVWISKNHSSIHLGKGGDFKISLFIHFFWTFFPSFRFESCVSLSLFLGWRWSCVIVLFTDSFASRIRLFLMMMIWDGGKNEQKLDDRIFLCILPLIQSVLTWFTFLKWIISMSHFESQVCSFVLRMQLTIEWMSEGTVRCW